MLALSSEVSGGTAPGDPVGMGPQIVSSENVKRSGRELQSAGIGVGRRMLLVFSQLFTPKGQSCSEIVPARFWTFRTKVS